MAKKDIVLLKEYFETGDQPTQQQFWDFLDSFVHKDAGVVITGKELTEEGLVLTFSDDSTITVPVFTLTNQETSFINGLDQFIEDVNTFIENLILTDNNFTNQNLQDLNDLIAFFENFATFTGEIGVLQIVKASPIINGGSTAGEIVDNWATPIVLQKGQLLTVDYFEADFSDGNHARKKITAVFALPAGTYGLGSPAEGNIFADTYLVAKIPQPDTREVILTESFRSFGINKNFTAPEIYYIYASQADWNVAAYDYVAAIDKPVKSGCYMEVTRQDEDNCMKWQDAPFNLPFTGEQYKLQASVDSVVCARPDAIGFSTIFSLQGGSDKEIYNKISLGFFGDGGVEPLFVALKLEKFNNGDIVHRYFKVVEQIQTEEGEPTTEAEILADIFVGETGFSVTGEFIVNNKRYKLDEPEQVEVSSNVLSGITSHEIAHRLGLDDPIGNSADFRLYHFGYWVAYDSGIEIYNRKFWLNEFTDSFSGQEFVYSNPNLDGSVIRIFRKYIIFKAIENARTYFKTNQRLSGGKNSGIMVEDLLDFERQGRARIYRGMIGYNSAGSPQVEASYEKNELGVAAEFSLEAPDTIRLSMPNTFISGRFFVTVSNNNTFTGGNEIIPTYWVQDSPDVLFIISETNFVSGKVQIWIKIEVEQY